MSRFGDNIRKIAKTKDLEEKIIHAEEVANQALKAAIEAQRGIAYLNSATGNVGNTQTGTPGVTPPTNSGSDYPHGGGSGEAGGDGSTNGDALLDGSDRPAIGEKQGKIELKDCDTGEPIDVRFDTASNKGEAVFDGPTGWNKNTPPVYDGFELGSFWSASNPFPAQGATPEQYAIAAIKALKLAFPPPGPYDDAYYDAGSFVNIDVNTWNFTWYASIGGPPATVPVSKNGCTSEPEDI